MEQASSFRRLTMGLGREAKATDRDSRRMATIERLEGRCLLSSVITGTSVTLYEQPGVPFTADLGNFVTIAPGTNLQAAITWGDGSFSQGVVKADGVVGIDEVNFEVDGTHTYNKVGMYRIQAIVYQPSPTPTTAVRLVATFNDEAIVARGNTVLNGVISGTYLAAPTSVAVGAEYIFNGTGTAGVLGPVSAHGDVILPGPAHQQRRLQPEH